MIDQAHYSIMIDHNVCSSMINHNVCSSTWEPVYIFQLAVIVIMDKGNLEYFQSWLQTIIKIRICRRVIDHDREGLANELIEHCMIDQNSIMI